MESYLETKLPIVSDNNTHSTPDGPEVTIDLTYDAALAYFTSLNLE